MPLSHDSSQAGLCPVMDYHDAGYSSKQAFDHDAHKRVFDFGTQKQAYNEGHKQVPNINGQDESKEAIAWNDRGQDHDKYIRSDSNGDGASRGDRSGANARKRQLRWRWFLICAAFVVCAVVAIVVGVVVSRKSGTQASSSESTPPSGDSKTSPNSTHANATTTFLKSSSGAYNGTDIAIVDPLNEVDKLWLVYQHHTGDLRRVILSPQGTWGASKSLGLPDVANGTGLVMMPMHNPDQSVMVVLVYSGSDGTLHNLIFANFTNNFDNYINGTLGSAGFRVPTSPMPARSMGYGFDASNRTSLFAAGLDGFVHEYLYDPATEQWTDNFPFPRLNGFAMTSPGATGTLTTLHGVDTNANLRLWWKVSNSSSAGTWTQGQAATAPAVYANSSGILPSEGNRVLYQNENGSIASLGWTGQMAGQLWEREPVSTGMRAMLGSAITGHYDGAAGGNINVFCQVQGDDVVRYSGAGSRWTLVETLPVD